MHTKVGYNLYLPPDYAVVGNTNRYPVIYWLHGRGCSENSDQFPATTIDAAIRSNAVPPLIFVYASGGGMSFYSDSAMASGSRKPPLSANSFRTSMPPTGAFRAVKPAPSRG
jgi:S-formylglutathione hydrolase FrmB